ncbi:MAG: hypothetical protein LBD63_02595 [Mycoplasmataceae bacterium]|jgi:hypothetical protein|nr:hypothetical protein [Mycoplasmataceae bacterium]
MKINKKIGTIGCATLALCVIGGTVISSLAITHDNKKETKNTTPSYHINYDHEEINCFVNRNDFAKKCLTTKDNLMIDEQKFRENIGDILKSALKKMNKFANNADSYTIELNYQFINPQTTDLDVVWYLPGTNPHKYYDQFEISLAV